MIDFIPVLMIVLYNFNHNTLPEFSQDHESKIKLDYHLHEFIFGSMTMGALGAFCPSTCPKAES